MVLLFGCDHRAQTHKKLEPDNDLQKIFRERLTNAIDKYRPTLIAEEHHPDILEKRGLLSVAAEVALKKGIPHRFCEPSFEEKNKLGIKGPPCVPPWDNYEAMHRYFMEEWPVREQFWIQQLSEDLNGTVIFICGGAHRETLRRQFELRNIKARIIEKGLTLPASDFRAYRDAYKKRRQSGFVNRKDKDILG